MQILSSKDVCETSSIDSLSEEDTSVYGTASSDFSDEETTTSSIDEYIPDYPFYPDDGQLTLDDLDKIGPGACLFDGKVYVSAQQIPRENPCDFCFCFRGDIICLQQSFRNWHNKSPIVFGGNIIQNLQLLVDKSYWESN